jgi:CDGSH-type Zn-finger protein
MTEKNRTSITPAPDSPYIVKGLENLSNRKGPIETKPQMAGCRCGGSSNQPFCDGSHWHKEFTDDKN